MSVTLTDVLTQSQTVVLYGKHITDIVPRGHLGLDLDPEGPVSFALVRCAAVGSRSLVPQEPVVLTVYGEGTVPEPDDPLAQAGERCWRALTADLALRLDIRKASIMSLLKAGSQQD